MKPKRKRSSPKLVPTAIAYDFDGTLAPGSIQGHSLIPKQLKVSASDFWNAGKVVAEKNDADEILVYLWRLIERARALGTPITRAMLHAHGKGTQLFNGVSEWFDRINAYARERGLKLEHYVISSGNEEMINATPIARHFRRIFASRYLYDEHGHAMWPAVAINYTTKTQFLFRINKGILNSWDNEQINRWVPMNERPIPFSRMIFIGDGGTDIPSMKMVRFQGGHSIAVFDPESFQQSPKKVYRLIAEDRVHFVAPADYSDGSQLDVTIKGILARMARDVGYRGRD